MFFVLHFCDYFVDPLFIYLFVRRFDPTFDGGCNITGLINKQTIRVEGEKRGRRERHVQTFILSKFTCTCFCLWGKGLECSDLLWEILPRVSKFTCTCLCGERGWNAVTFCEKFYRELWVPITVTMGVVTAPRYLSPPRSLWTLLRDQPSLFYRLRQPSKDTGVTKTASDEKLMAPTVGGSSWHWRISRSL